MNYTLPKLAQELKCDKSKIINCIKYLQIKESGFLKKNTPYYTENDLIKIRDLISNTDTRKLFYSMKMQEKYGVDNYFERSDLIKKSMSDKYGADNPLKVEDIRNKVKNNWKNKSKEEIDELTSKTKKTKLEKYGDENFNNSNKFKNTNENNINLIKNKYSVFTVKDIAKSLMVKTQKIADICIKLNIGFVKNKRLYLNDDEIEIIKNHINNHKGDRYSYSEKEVLSFIQSIYHNEIIENARDIIPPKELDIYISSKKLAIEFDGLFWHNELHLDNNYHLDKTNSCNSKGIDLIHIFEDDWLNHKEIVKSMIASRLGIYERKIFARKCEIKTVDKELCKKFFDENHLQGFAKGDIYLGLFYNDELVQSIIINKKGWHDGNVELTRMVTKLNCQVIGGFSKLMKHLVNDYNFNSITSYVYKAWFNGKGYEESGFKVINENKPSYSYIVNDSRVHKSKFRKEKIKKLYEEGILKYWNEKESEHENMLKNGIFRIYDCGTIKVEYNCKLAKKNNNV